MTVPELILLTLVTINGKAWPKVQGFAFSSDYGLTCWAIRPIIYYLKKASQPEYVTELWAEFLFLFLKTTVP